MSTCPPCCSLPRHHSTSSREILRQRGRKHHRELDQVEGSWRDRYKENRIEVCDRSSLHFQTELLGSTLYRKFKTFIAVLRERTFGSTTGVKTRAGNCLQALGGSSSLLSSPLLWLSPRVHINDQHTSNLENYGS